MFMTPDKVVIAGEVLLQAFCLSQQLPNQNQKLQSIRPAV